MDICDLKDAVTNAGKSIVSTAHTDEARWRRGRRPRAREALRCPRIAENEVRGTSNRVFGSPHLPVPIPQQSADDEPIEPCAARDVILATAWIIGPRFEPGTAHHAPPLYGAVCAPRGG